MTLYIFFAIIVFFGLIFSFISRKFSNPYKFIFVFGKKGSGKSCFMVHEMIKHIKKGWTVYTDMPVFIDGVRIIEDADTLFKKYTPEPHSLICLDEIGVTWHSREFKSFDKKIREWFKYQRKYQCKVIANSQSFDIDKGLRELTDSMILQSNIGNIISVSRPIVRSVTVTDASITGESKIVDQLGFVRPWHYKFYLMPKYFKYFKSFDAPDRPSMPYHDATLDESSVNTRSHRLFLKSANKKLRKALKKLDKDNAS